MDHNFKRKKEIAPLFKPQEKLQWNHGMPNRTDIIRDRMNPSLIMNNSKPFQEVRVGPSSMRTDDNTSGTGGFNSGMLGRDQWMPKNVDELRTANNKKESYGGVVLGGKYNVTNMGKLGKVEKHTPDTYYLNTPGTLFYNNWCRKSAYKSC